MDPPLSYEEQLKKDEKLTLRRDFVSSIETAPPFVYDNIEKKYESKTYEVDCGTY